MNDEWHEPTEEERRWLDLIRRWHRPMWVAVGVFFVIGMYMKLKQLGGW
jgi:hypothetical protein